MFVGGMGLLMLGMGSYLGINAPGGIGYYLVAGGLACSGLYVLGVAIVGEKKSVEKTLDSM